MVDHSSQILESEESHHQHHQVYLDTCLKAGQLSFINRSIFKLTEPPNKAAFFIVVTSDVFVAEPNARCRHGTSSVHILCSSSVMHVRVVAMATVALATPALVCEPSTGEPCPYAPVLSACRSWRTCFEAASDVIRNDVTTSAA